MMPDWWALGVIIYRLMEKKGPWDPSGKEWEKPDNFKDLPEIE